MLTVENVFLHYLVFILLFSDRSAVRWSVFDYLVLNESLRTRLMEERKMNYACYCE